MPHHRARAALLFAMSLLMFAPGFAPAAAAAEGTSSTGVAFGHTSAGMTRTGNTTSVTAGGAGATVTRERNRTRISIQSRGSEARTRTTQRGRWERLAVSRSDSLSKLQEARRLQAEKRELAMQQIERSRGR